MKEDKAMMQDDLLPEYDLKKLRVRRVGPGRKFFAGKPVSQLVDNTAKVSPNDVFVNKGLLLSLISVANSCYRRKLPNSSIISISVW